MDCAAFQSVAKRIFKPENKVTIVNSLDPRVNRLPAIGMPGQIAPKAPLDQFGTFEVFVQPKEGKSFQHEGIVHAPNLEMAYVLAKEAFTRRFLCTSLYVTDTRNVYVSPLTEENTDAYDMIPEVPSQPGEKVTFEIYHLVKRGKQHTLALVACVRKLVIIINVVLNRGSPWETREGTPCPQ